ncbi:bifunctional helix-turn-helix transcriptional regulator/GNAT family N-acetyltransferase [Cedecea lapagei]|jgi:putative acetyltransferase|uniref:bifunctional helix-turn-helix transcriptional regulator/GNAT family N-acetyltransferase n=1 Tax=Cedecea lapagei TaxID=158823 RepID=UPI001BD1950C|nr:bifunctional helix-turn-helix transcriptional regulator/GNAT family N-acetyltransferase [Cedecea lapagei]
MQTNEIEEFRAALREMVRELGMLNRKSSGTDLSPLQSHILIELDREPAGVTELARRLCVEKSSISRTLRGLESANLLARTQDESDGRATVFNLSHEGVVALKDLTEHANDFTAQALSLASDSEKQQIYQSVKSLTRALVNARSQRDLQVQIRPIRREDNLAIADVIRQSFRDNKIDHLEGVSLHDPALNDLTSAYQKPGSGYWVVEHEGKILGGVGIAPLQGAGEEYCELQKLYLDSSVTGIGLGRRLMALAIQQAEAFGYRYCYLETLDELSSAVSLYEAFGFKHLGSSLGNTGHNSCEICMLKTLK